MPFVRNLENQILVSWIVWNSARWVLKTSRWRVKWVFHSDVENLCPFWPLYWICKQSLKDIHNSVPVSTHYRWKIGNWFKLERNAFIIQFWICLKVIEHLYRLKRLMTVLKWAFANIHDSLEFFEHIKSFLTTLLEGFEVVNAVANWFFLFELLDTDVNAFKM
jgi:hypothetical protein